MRYALYVSVRGEAPYPRVIALVDGNHWALLRVALPLIDAWLQGYLKICVRLAKTTGVEIKLTRIYKHVYNDCMAWTRTRALEERMYDVSHHEPSTVDS
jgi:hypothetical protein